jgi:hypothetical protein
MLEGTRIRTDGVGLKGPEDLTAGLEYPQLIKARGASIPTINKPCGCRVLIKCLQVSRKVDIEKGSP